MPKHSGIGTGLVLLLSMTETYVISEIIIIFLLNNPIIKIIIFYYIFCIFEILYNLNFVKINLLIVIVTISYLYFYFFLGKATKSIENSQMNIKKNKDLDRVDSLDHFLNEDEINKKN